MWPWKVAVKTPAPEVSEESKHLTIGLRIRRLRIQKGLTQQQVERATGLKQGFISRVERGLAEPSLKTLERFAAALGAPFYQLFLAEEGPGRTISVEALKHLAKRRGRAGSQARFLLELRSLCGRLGDSEQETLLDLASRLATPVSKRTAEGSWEE